MIKSISLTLMILLYIAAGINHFVHPVSYYPLIPPYLPYHHLINTVSGLAEILLGMLLILPASRKAGACGIILLLILFIPTHIYMIQKGGCMDGGMCVPAWVAWVRLFPLQFILMWWAWTNRR